MINILQNVNKIFLTNKNNHNSYHKSDMFINIDSNIFSISKLIYYRL